VRDPGRMSIDCFDCLRMVENGSLGSYLSCRVRQILPRRRSSAMNLEIAESLASRHERRLKRYYQ